MKAGLCRQEHRLLASANFASLLLHLPQLVCTDLTLPDGAIDLPITSQVSYRLSFSGPLFVRLALLLCLCDPTNCPRCLVAGLWSAFSLSPVPFSLSLSPVFSPVLSSCSLPSLSPSLHYFTTSPPVDIRPSVGVIDFSVIIPASSVLGLIAGTGFTSIASDLSHRLVILADPRRSILRSARPSTSHPQYNTSPLVRHRLSSFRLVVQSVILDLPSP